MKTRSTKPKFLKCESRSLFDKINAAHAGDPDPTELDLLKNIRRIVRKRAQDAIVDDEARLAQLEAAGLVKIGKGGINWDDYDAPSDPEEAMRAALDEDRKSR